MRLLGASSVGYCVGVRLREIVKFDSRCRCALRDRSPCLLAIIWIVSIATWEIYCSRTFLIVGREVSHFFLTSGGLIP